MIKQWFKRWFKGNFTFLVLRNADQSVKQFRISKLLLFVAPISAMVAILILIGSIGWLSTYKIVLSQQVKELQTTLQDKDGAILDKEESIQNLQNEVIHLSTQAKDLQERIEQISELEKELQELISNYSDKKRTVSIKSIDSDTDPNLLIQIEDHVGGEYVPMSEQQAFELAEETNATLSQLEQDLAVLDENISSTMKKAEQFKQMMDRTPSLWPTISTRITSDFGYRKDPIRKTAAYHKGLDIGANYGDPVYAAGAGKVIDTGRTKTDGKYVIIEHYPGLRTKYMHLSSILVKEKAEVTRGQTIGKAGNTGRSTGVHLHFEVIKNGVQVDPIKYISDSK